MIEIGGAYKEYSGNLYIGDERYVLAQKSRILPVVGRDFVPLRQITKQTFPVNRFTEQICFTRFLYSTVFDKWKMGFDLEKGINFGRSVVISAIQIAASRGYKKIALIGVDTEYRKEKDYLSGMEDVVEYVNPTFISDPRLHMEPFLVILQIYLERMGVELVDCSEGALRFINKSTLGKEMGL